MTSKITRESIHSAVIEAFVAPPVHRDDLLAAADRAGAAPRVLKALTGIPEDCRFQHVRDLWKFLPEVPIQ